MDKKTFLAFALIAFILILTPYYLDLLSPPQAQEGFAPGIVTQTDSIATSRTTSPQEKPSLITGDKLNKNQLAIKTSEQIEEQLITIQTNLYEAIISSAGGGSIQSYLLYDYSMYDSLSVQLITEHNKKNLLISFISLDGDPYVLDQPWDYDNSASFFDASGISKTLIFKTTVLGQEIRKSMTFHPDSYKIDIHTDLSSLDGEIRQNNFKFTWTGGLPITEKNKKDDLFYFRGYAMQGGELSDPKLDEDDNKTQSFRGNTRWVAVKSKYFTAAFIPDNYASGAEIGGYYEGDTPHYEVSLIQNIHQNMNMVLYLGPLEFKRIEALGVELDRIMNLGWSPIRPIGKAILAVLFWLHIYIPNYGVILLLFAILIKLATYPLTKKSYQSTQKMQQVQPLVAALKEKYGKDPQRLNKETMALYKERGVNPLGGCLPILIQMPLLIALFQVFRSTIELRGKPFILWITDLSAPDTLMEIGGFPINILPIFMAVTMLVQQQMMSTPGNSQQKQMSYVMNVVFLFIFYKFPSGLNLYYTLFNLLTILQQKFLTPKSGNSTPVQVSGALKKK